MTAPLVIAAHGSRDPGWSGVIEEIVGLLRARRPGLRVEIGYVDVQSPTVRDLLRPGAVVVPLLLSRGYHVVHDIEGPAAACHASVSEAVGPDPRLSAALLDRLSEAGVASDTPVVLAATGSSDPRARADVETQGRHLATSWPAEVRVAFAGGPGARVADAVDGLRADGHPRVAVASYLLAPGHFADVIAAAGGDVTSAPVGAHPAVVDVVLARLDAVMSARATPA